MIDVDVVVDRLKNRENIFLLHNGRKFCLPFEYLIEYAREVYFDGIDFGYFTMKNDDSIARYVVKDGEMVL